MMIKSATGHLPGLVLTGAVEGSFRLKLSFKGHPVFIAPSSTATYLVEVRGSPLPSPLQLYHHTSPK